MVEKYTEPSFVGMGFTTWSDKQQQIIKVEFHNAEFVENSFVGLPYSTKTTNITWILPYAEYSKYIRNKFKILNQGIDVI